MRQGKPSSFVRGNIRNAVPIKRRLSADYSSSTRLKTVKQLKARKSLTASKNKNTRVDLLNSALQAFEHWLSHGDHTSMTKLVQGAAGYRTRNVLVRWFERVSGLQWDKAAAIFRGRDRTKALSVEAAAAIPIWSVNRFADGRPASSSMTPIVSQRSRKCCVCGHPAMPDEDTCYHHQSG